MIKMPFNLFIKELKFAFACTAAVCCCRFFTLFSHFCFWKRTLCLTVLRSREWQLVDQVRDTGRRRGTKGEIKSTNWGVFKYTFTSLRTVESHERRCIFNSEHSSCCFMSARCACCCLSESTHTNTHFWNKLGFLGYSNSRVLRLRIINHYFPYR